MRNRASGGLRVASDMRSLHHFAPEDRIEVGGQASSLRTTGHRLPGQWKCRCRTLTLFLPRCTGGRLHKCEPLSLEQNSGGMCSTSRVLQDLLSPPDMLTTPRAY